MKTYKQKFSIEQMVKVLSVKRGGYYKWLSRGVSKEKQENERLFKEIKEIFQFHKKRYGSNRICRELLKQGTGAVEESR